jgi:lysozyme family protein
VKDNFTNCHAITLKWEGYDSDHPADPGGKTRWGITQATYDAWRVEKGYSKRSVFKMERYEMLEIYKAGYWDAVRGDELPAGVDLMTWDFGVNSGPSRSGKTLQSIAGVSQDGKIGGQTIAAVSELSATEVIQKIAAKRMSFLRGLLGTFKSFGKGWSARVADVEARAVKMALAGTTTVKSSLMIEAMKADTSAKTKANATKATGSASAASAVSTNGVDQYLAWGLLGLAVIGVAITVYFAVKAKHDKARAEAYTRVAEEA